MCDCVFISNMLLWLKENGNLLTAIGTLGTLGMCFCSWSNIKHVKKQATYTNKIISTKNLLYSILCLKRQLILAEMKKRTNILEKFICYFLLKKLKKNKCDNVTEFELDFCFNDLVKTSEDAKKKIREVFPLDWTEDNFDYYKNRYDKLVEIIKIYFGEELFKSKIKDGKYAGEYEIIYFILTGEIEHLLGINEIKGKMPDMPIHVECDWSLQICPHTEANIFWSFVRTQEGEINDRIFKKFFDCFKKFYFPIKQVYFTSENKDCSIYDTIKGLINNYVKALVLDYSEKEELLLRYNKICSKIDHFFSFDLSDGIVAKISEDLDKAGVYYITNILYKIKKKYYFNKLDRMHKKQIIVDQDISFSVSPNNLFLLRYMVLKVKKEDQKHANNKKK